MGGFFEDGLGGGAGVDFVSIVIIIFRISRSVFSECNFGAGLEDL